MDGNSNRQAERRLAVASLLQELLPAENLESLDLGWNPIDETGFEA